jgi:fructokinase
MPTVFTIGETILDIIFREGKPVAAKAGGSMLNTAVSLGRCGARVEMITELGDDQAGKLVLDFLAENGVSTSFIKPVAGFKTPVSLAFLDEEGNAHYSFYKNYPEKRLCIDWPAAEEGDVVLFGSFYSLDATVHDIILSFVRKSKESGALVIFDPNIRKNHLPEIMQLIAHVEENLSVADIIRGSDEDFQNLFGLSDSEGIFKRVKQAGCNHLVITRGAKGSELLTDLVRLRLPARPVKVVSTIGAGDAFNAGLILNLIRNEISVDNLFHKNTEQWSDILKYAAIFAGDACSSIDNYISRETAQQFHG